MDKQPDPMMVDAVAAKALLLEPGGSFVAEVEGDEAYAERVALAIEDALEQQYDAGAQMGAVLARSEAIGFRVVAGETRYYVVIEHLVDD